MIDSIPSVIKIDDAIEAMEAEIKDVLEIAEEHIEDGHIDEASKCTKGFDDLSKKLRKIVHLCFDSTGRLVAVARENGISEDDIKKLVHNSTAWQK